MNLLLLILKIWISSSCFVFSFLAEELSILLYVCVFNNYAMHICVCILLGQHQENNGNARMQIWKSSFEVSYLWSSHLIHIYCCVVCGRVDIISSLLDFDKSGKAILW
jgi:hypothetical protein